MKNVDESGNILKQTEKSKTNLEKCISGSFHQYSNSVDNNITLAYKVALRTGTKLNLQKNATTEPKYESENILMSSHSVIILIRQYDYNTSFQKLA